MSQHQDLVRFLFDCAQEAAADGRRDEAEELITLRARVIARRFDAGQLELPLNAKAAA